MLGLAQLSETREHGIHVGYRITCRRHKNAGDPDHIECKKDITMGKTADRLEERECRLRLKRWFLGGANRFNEDSWPEGAKRTYHTWKYGGSRLCELATDYELCPLFGVEEDELDALCTTTV